MSAGVAKPARRFTDRELAAEARREAFMRRRVYQRWVSDGKLTQEDADLRIDMMEAIATRLNRLSIAAASDVDPETLERGAL